MPIVKYIAVHSTPLNNIEYILNGEKNDEMKFATGLNCNANVQDAYDEFRRTFELCARERFYKTGIEVKEAKNAKSKVKIRLHHYIQSFDPKDNVSPEEAHQIGIEWAKETFGKNIQIIVSTHLDKGHIHNHFAVCPFDLSGKQWYANLTSLRRARNISDKISLEHGLSIIEEPKHKNTMKYVEWFTKQNGTSWKHKLIAEIDKIILRDDVKNISDLSEKLRESGYIVREGKYLSIKAPKQKNAIRSFRLGDGYSVENLEYRIEHKEKEISLSAIQQYSGIQREYALCMRQMQIAVFLKKPKRVTYDDLQKSAELLNYLNRNNISSYGDFENRVNATVENYDVSLQKRNQLSSQIEEMEKLIADGKIYISLCSKDILSADEREIYDKVSYVERRRISGFSDIFNRERHIADLKKELSALEIKVEEQKSERDYLTDMFKTYKRDIEENPYDEILQQLEEEQQFYDMEQENDEVNRKRISR